MFHQWLYRYIFRGIGILFVIGMLTVLFLAIRSEHEHSVPQPTKSSQRP